MKNFKQTSRLSVCLTFLLAAFFLTGCKDDADVAKYNMRKASDNFEVQRRVVFYNAITDKIIMVTEGRCSVEPRELRTAVICKVGDDEYIENFYGKSDNTLYFIEQMETVAVKVYHYRRTFKPQAMLPDVDFRGDAGAVVDAVTPDSND